MAVRSDVTFDWVSSPRVVTVLAPSTEILIQDLYDTLRYNEAFIWNLCYPVLCAASGKEPLGGDKYAGIVLTLLNCKLAFEARPEGEWEHCIVSGGTLIGLDEADEFTNPILPTAYTQITREVDRTGVMLKSECFDSFLGGKQQITSEGGGTLEVYGADNVTLYAKFSLFDGNGNRTTNPALVVRRERAA